MLGGKLSGHIFSMIKWYDFDDGIYVFLRFLGNYYRTMKRSCVIDEIKKNVFNSRNRY